MKPTGYLIVAVNSMSERHWIYLTEICLALERLERLENPKMHDGVVCVLKKQHMVSVSKRAANV